MRYKIALGSELYSKLDALKSRLLEVGNAAQTLAEEYGFKEYVADQNSLRGGIAAFRIAGEVDKKEWSRVGKKYQRLYFPKHTKNNKGLRLKLLALPTMSYEELNVILNFSPGCKEGFTWYSCPLVYYKEEYILVNVGNQTYVPVEGMTEIMDSEYFSLKDTE